jgi:uncharacterized repeat protein (TIGR01451 family)
MCSPSTRPVLIAISLIGLVTTGSPAASQEVRARRETRTLVLPPQHDVLSVAVNAPTASRLGDNFRYSIEVTNRSDSITFSHIGIAQLVGSGIRVESSEGGDNVSQGGQQGQGSTGSTTSDQQTQGHAGSQSGAQSQGQETLQQAGGSTAMAAHWQIKRLEPGETAVIDVTASADRAGQQPICLAITSFTPQVCIPLNVVNPQLEFVKTGPKTVGICGAFEYGYYLKNTGTGNIRPFVVEERLPAGLSTVTGDKSIRFEVDGLAPEEVRKFVAEIVPQYEGNYESRAHARFERDKPIRSNVTTTQVMAAKAAVSIEALGSVESGGRINYTVRVGNTGEVAAPDVWLILQYPQDLRFDWMDDVVATSQSVKADQSQQSRQRQQSQWRSDRQDLEIEQGQWPLGDLEPGETVELRFSARPDADMENVPLRAVARFGCTDARDAAVDTSVAYANTRIVSLPALALAIMDAEDPVRVGSEITYRIALKNEGDDQDSNVRVTAELPEGLEFVNARGDTAASQQGRSVAFDAIPTLPPGETRRWTLVARPKQGGTTRVTAKVTSDMLQQPASISEPTTLFARSSQQAEQSNQTGQNPRQETQAQGSQNQPVLEKNSAEGQSQSETQNQGTDQSPQDNQSSQSQSASEGQSGQSQSEADTQANPGSTNPATSEPSQSEQNDASQDGSSQNQQNATDQAQTEQSETDIQQSADNSTQ